MYLSLVDSSRRLVKSYQPKLKKDKEKDKDRDEDDLE